MPCRPASHDYRETDGVKSRALALKWLADRKTTRELLLAWATDPNYKFSTALQRSVTRVIDQALEENLPRCPTGAGPNAREQVGEWALGMAFREDREQVALCEARCVLAKVARIAGPPPAPLAQQVEAQLRSHRAHRFGDRQAMREQIESTLRGLKAAVPNPRNEKRKAQMLESLAAIDRLSESELLESRESLKKLWP